MEAALRYAAGGTPVFPCNERPGDFAKAPRIPKAQGGRGHLDATTDPAQICDWWIRWPDALIGRPVPSHLICLDLDPRHGGTITALVETFGAVPHTRYVISGRGDGGAHLFYQRPAGAISGAALKRICPGVDIKLDTGYTILPPSPHPDTGKPYRWGGPLTHAELPDSIRKALAPPPRPTPSATDRIPTAAKLDGLLRRVRDERTNRNDVLFWAASRLVEGGYPEPAYDAIATAALSTGLAQFEVNKTIDSARKALTS